jgi:hypothetical protein
MDARRNPYAPGAGRPPAALVGRELQRATRGEQQYLRAMAQDGDSSSSSGEVAGRLNRKQPALGPVRAKLISKGLIYAPEHGMVQFTVPGMADFINRQAAG